MADAQEDQEEGIVVLVVELWRCLDQFAQFLKRFRPQFIRFAQLSTSDLQGFWLQVAYAQMECLLADVHGSHIGYVCVM